MTESYNLYKLEQPVLADSDNLVLTGQEQIQRIPVYLITNDKGWVRMWYRPDLPASQGLLLKQRVEDITVLTAKGWSLPGRIQIYLSADDWQHSPLFILGHQAKKTFVSEPLKKDEEACYIVTPIDGYSTFNSTQVPQMHTGQLFEEFATDKIIPAKDIQMPECTSKVLAVKSLPKEDCIAIAQHIQITAKPGNEYLRIQQELRDAATGDLAAVTQRDRLNATLDKIRYNQALNYISREGSWSDQDRQVANLAQKIAQTRTTELNEEIAHKQTHFNRLKDELDLIRKFQNSEITATLESNF